MKVELHLHTSRYSACAVASPIEILTYAVEAGYYAVCITDHNTVWADDDLDELRREVPDLIIIPGIERTLGRSDLLILGTNDPDYVKLDDPEIILDRARDAGHLTVLAHPYRWEGAHDILDDGLVPDAMEYRTGTQWGPACEQSLKAARRLNLPVVNSGDVHGGDYLNQYWIETDADIVNGAELREAVLARRYKLSPDERGLP